MSILTAAVRLANKSRVKKLEQGKRNPQPLQAAIFNALIKAGTQTEFGRQYYFKEITSLEKFQQQVPLHEYDHLQPYIDRMRQGEQNILWNTPVRWYAKSSGTTAGKSKFIPVSKESLAHCHYRGTKDVLLFYLENHPKSKLFHGKSLTLGGSHRPEVNGRIRNGDISAVMIQNSPAFSEPFRTPPRHIALLPDFETKVQKNHSAKCYFLCGGTFVEPGTDETYSGDFRQKQSAGSMAKHGIIHAWGHQLCALPGAIQAAHSFGADALHGNLQCLGRVLRNTGRPGRHEPAAAY